MKPTEYIWKNGKMIPWIEATTHVMTHALHYGSGVFEGIRFYETEQGPAIFKLQEHVDRLLYSAQAMGMEVPFSHQDLCDAIVETVSVNKATSGYIRPLVYYGYGTMGVMPTQETPIDVVVACWPWGKYLPVNAVDVKTSDFIRIHPESTVADAKICGHYVNSMMAGLAIKNTKYHEAILLDDAGYVAEGSAENIFIVKDGALLTPKPGTILEGITRNTVIELAEEWNIQVHETHFRPEAVIDADEAFFCGTAVEITPIHSLDDHLIANGEPGPITKKIQEAYQQIIHGQHPGFKSALTWVSPDHTEHQ